MGKRIRVQRRGRGGSTYRASTHKRVAAVKYPQAFASKEFFNSSVDGVVEALLHDPGRGAPLSLLRFANGVSCYTVTPEGIFVGRKSV